MKKKSVAGIIFNERSVFIAFRSPVGQMASRWEFPGGKVEDGESCEVALKRELKEEFGVEATVGSCIARGSFSHNDDIVDLYAFVVTLKEDGIERRFTLSEHTDYKWVDIDEIPSLLFVDSDMLLYEEVKKYILSHTKEKLS